jgi:arginase
MSAVCDTRAMTTVLCVPQWQGSSSPHARRLAAGARQTAALVPAAARIDVPVLDSDGPKAEGVRRLEVLKANLRMTEDALTDLDGVVVAVGGDCGVELAPIAAARARHGDQLKVLWIDAHPDVSTPETLPSGSFHGMVLRTLLGDGAAALVPEEPLAPEQVVLTGIRAFEPGQREYLEQTRISWWGVEDFERALDGLDGPVYVHFDLDVLDPAEFKSVCYREPEGIGVQRAIDLIARVDDIVGASITEHAPRDDADFAHDAEVARRIGVALSR